MRRLILIQAAVGRKKGVPFLRSWQLQPLGIARLAALTPADWQLTFMDDRMEPIDFEQPAELVGISIETYTAKRGYQLAAEFRSRGIPVVFGGFHATLCPDEAAAHADAVCVGEAEAVWGPILRDAAAGNLKKFYHGDKTLPLTGIAPDRSIFKGKNYMPLALVETSRGCPFGCHFCSIASAYQNIYRRRPIQEIVDELKTIKEKYIFFVDDNVVGDPESARELCAAIAPLKRKWMSQGSLHALKDDQTVAALKKSGCMGLLIGFETLNPDNLHEMGKRSNRVEEYSLVLKKLRRAGIFVYGTFIFGYPNDTRATFDASLAFARKEKLMIGSFNHAVPFPGTRLFREARQDGRLTDPHWWLSEHYHMGKALFPSNQLTEEEIERQCQRVRKSFYGLPSRLARAWDFECNSRDFTHIKAFWLLNFFLNKEAVQTRGVPLAGEV
jgi:radical SAM superfamily enzyme YgiQ (UPF0313 family)